MVSCLQDPHLLRFLQGEEAKESCMLAISSVTYYCSVAVGYIVVYRVGQSGMLSMCASPPITLLSLTIGLSNK